MGCRISTFLGLVVGLLVAAPLAWGQGVGGERQAQTRKAQAYLDLATKMFRDGDFEGALAELQRAEPLVADPVVKPLVRFNIARCYEELGLAIRAIAAYRHYLEIGEDNSRRKTRAYEVIKRLRTENVGRLIVHCRPADARVLLTETKMSRDSCPADFGDILRGEYVVRVERSGYTPVARRVSVAPSETQRLRVSLAPVPAPAPASEAPISRTVPVKPRSNLRWTLLGSASAMLATGLVFHALAAGSRADVEALPPGPRRDEIRSTFESQRGLALTGYGIGAVLLGAGWYVFTQQSDGRTTALGLSPTGVHARISF